MPATPSPLGELNLDAAMAAASEGAGKPIPLVAFGETFDLPAGLPLDVLAPLLPVLPALWAVIGPMLDDDAKDVDVNTAVLALVGTSLPDDLIRALDEVGRRLFDGLDEKEDSAWARFKKGRPTGQHYVALVRGLAQRYGVGLGELLRSSGRSVAGGPPSSATSNGIAAASTRPRSGAARGRRAG